MKQHTHEHFTDEQRIAYLQSQHPAVEAYEPSAEARDGVSDVDLVIVSGPSGSGKDTIINASGLHVARGVTTRPKEYRDYLSNGYGHFYDVFCPTGRDELEQDLRLGNLVQAEVYPTNDIYGSRPEGYKPRSILNATARTYELLRRKQLFRTIRQVYIVPSSTGHWLEQLDQRDGPNGSQRDKRIAEATGSLFTGLTNHEAIFIVNIHGEPEIAADQLKTVAERGSLPNHLLEAARHTGALMLKALTNLQPSRPSDELSA